MRTAEHQQNAELVQGQQEAKDRAGRDAWPRQWQDHLERHHQAVRAETAGGFDQPHVERRERSERRTDDERRVEHHFSENHPARAEQEVEWRRLQVEQALQSDTDRTLRAVQKDQREGHEKRRKRDEQFKKTRHEPRAGKRLEKQQRGERHAEQ